MAVGPVGAALAHREAVGECLARLDAAEADPRHTVHVRRYKHPVPVDRGDLLQAVRDAQDSGVALAQPEEWPRHRAVEGNGLTDPAVDRQRDMVDSEIKDPLAWRVCDRTRQ